MQSLTNLHPRLCGAIPRYAVLRWTIGGESDCCFWRHFHKLGPCICGCGRLADTYPYGLAQAHLAAQATLPPQTYRELRPHIPSESARAYPGAYYQRPSVGPAHDDVSPCVLCGTGNNCVDHWMRHCLILPITPLLLIGTKALQGIQQIAQQSQHGLALATHLIFHIRKTIHEKGGLADTPTTHPPANNPPLIRATCEQIAGAVVASLATETILHHNITFQPLPEPGCTRLIQTAITRLSPLHLAGQLQASCTLPLPSRPYKKSQREPQYS